MPNGVAEAATPELAFATNAGWPVPAIPLARQPWGLPGVSFPRTTWLLPRNAPGFVALPGWLACWLGVAKARAELARAPTEIIVARVTLDAGIARAAVVAGAATVTAFANCEPIDAGGNFLRPHIGDDADAIRIRRISANGVLVDIHVAPVEQLAATTGTCRFTSSPVTYLIVACIAAVVIAPDSVYRFAPAEVIVATLFCRAVLVGAAQPWFEANRSTLRLVVWTGAGPVTTRLIGTAIGVLATGCLRYAATVAGFLARGADARPVDAVPACATIRKRAALVGWDARLAALLLAALAFLLLFLPGVAL